MYDTVSGFGSLQESVRQALLRSIPATHPNSPPFHRMCVFTLEQIEHEPCLVVPTQLFPGHWRVTIPYSELCSILQGPLANFLFPTPSPTVKASNPGHTWYQVLTMLGIPTWLWCQPVVCLPLERGVTVV